jgi:hypothetical protein
LKRLLAVGLRSIPDGLRIQLAARDAANARSAGIIYFHHKGVFDPAEEAVPIASPQND